MTADLDRDIVAIRYNMLNLPDTVQFRNGSAIVNYYTADGKRTGSKYLTPLTTVVIPAGQTFGSTSGTAAMSSHVTARRGSLEYAGADFESDTLIRIHNGDGYLDCSEQDFRYFVRDYQGNIRTVYGSAVAKLIPVEPPFSLTNRGAIGGDKPPIRPKPIEHTVTYQRMQYYPFGLPYEAHYQPEEQPYKYGGKEFIELHGYDSYDFDARMYYPALCRFMTMDPLCEKYYSISPYAYCNNNPVNYVDPDGRDWYEYTDKDVFGRTLNLTSLINKPDGYLKGSLSDTQDVDYYKFNITEYRALSFAKDTYNKDITITLDHIPEGCDYEMVLYDEEGNQVGIGKENGNGGLSITIPNWNSDNRGYTVKVQAKNGSTVNPDAEYHLSFQTTQADKSHGAYQEMAEVQKYEGTVRKQMQEGLTDTEETRAIKEIRQKYKAYYTEQMEKLHQKQAEDVMQGGAVPDDEQIHNLLEKKAAGGELTEQENALLNIFCTAAELDRANASAKMNTTVKDRISADLQEAGIDISDSTFSIKIGADGQVSVDGINDNAMKQKIEDVLSKYSDDLMDIYFSMDSEIQALSDKEKYLLQAAVDVEKFLYKATGGRVSLGDLSVENTAIHGLPKTLDDLLNNPGDNLTYQDYASDIREILAYNRTQHKDIMSGLNVQFVIADGTFQIKD